MVSVSSDRRLNSLRISAMPCVDESTAVSWPALSRPLISCIVSTTEPVPMAITDEASNIRTSMRSNSACAADPWGMPASSAAVLIALSSADWRENA